MSLCCALTNETPEVAVVSPVSGCVFEKRVICKYIKEHGTDPINGKELTEEMLIEVKTVPMVKPKPPSATSIPAILKCLQDEWDAVMLNNFTLRQQLQTARQELSHALYQHDAACRVIARLTKEVTAAREALATLKPKTSAVTAIQSNPPLGDQQFQEQRTEEAGITPEVLEKLEAKAAVLTAERKKRGKSVPEDLVKPDDLRSYKTVASLSGLHSASVPGILALDICPTDTNKILTGGNDKNATIFNKDNEQVIAILKGHTKKVTSVIYHGNQTTAITASPDSQIRIWHIGTSQTTHVIRAHDGPITDLSLHATGDYLLSTSTDEYWAFSDLHTGQVLTKVGDTTTPHALTTAQFHPDGLIFGTGTSDSLIKIWDLKERTNVANFPGHSGSISAMTFSENGYYLATAADDSTIKLWDLRKLKNFKSILLDEGYQVKDLYFDRSGTYLAVAGTDVRIYISKQWENLKTFADHTALATGVRFGENARYIASTGMDRTLKIYSA
ncbi:pre-mRNA-processing factor 19-like protein [Dinothrombium tinctorium]|uniref:Pre-mRNA-processing factor 19 n=1 Tax=Dinothrombium tinctorium TaxID=1965070 RepID=A0A3S3S069_9ACAR|nr:pre-mRNA-processing factor 19-like protein [Dinothrombium tinctorium]